MTLRCILWDFGNTLADEDWMLRPPDAFPNWPEAWVEVARGASEEAWYVNEVTCDDIAQEVSALLGMPLSAVHKHIRHCCSNVLFFDASLRAAQESDLKQAIVTVNPDVFTNYVVSHYRLDEVFPVIVTSWEEGTVDKAALCAKAVRRLGGLWKHEEALLIDNNEDAVRDWEEAGGQGYVFRGETQLIADFASSLRGIRGDHTAEHESVSR